MRIKELTHRILIELAAAPQETEATLRRHIVEQRARLFACLDLMRYLARNNRGEEVEILLRLLRERGTEHPVLDRDISNYIWAYKDRKEAIAFMHEAARRWNKPFLEALAVLMQWIMEEDNAKDDGRLLRREIRDPVRFLKRLGGLHDGRIQWPIADDAGAHMGWRIDDLLSNFEPQPGWDWARSAQLFFVDCRTPPEMATLPREASDEIWIYECSATRVGERFEVRLAACPGGSVTFNCAGLAIEMDNFAALREGMYRAWMALINDPPDG